MKTTFIFKQMSYLKSAQKPESITMYLKSLVGNCCPCSPSPISEKINFMKKLLGQWQSSAKNIKCFLIAKGPINKPKYNRLHEIDCFRNRWGWARATISNQWFQIHRDRLSFLCWFQIWQLFEDECRFHSVQNPSNKCQKSNIDKKLLGVWLSGWPFSK